MQKLSYVMLCGLIALASCKNDMAFKKGQKGLEYKIISSGNGEKIKLGDFMQIHVGQFYDNGKSDSLLSDTRVNGGPLMEKMDSSTIPPAYYEILKQIKNHDSIVIRISTDSAYAKSPQGMPEIFKKGHYLTTTIKVVNVFTNKDAADSARVASMKIAQQKDSIKAIELIAKDDKTIEAYLSKNNLKAVKAPLGTYVEMIQPGTGANIDTSVVVSVNYTGRTMDGQMFDSNTDSSKGHVEPLNVNMTSDRSLGGGVIRGWYDGLKLLSKGAKAKFYIPSALAYGPGSRPGIPANSILIFDIEVVDILNKETAKKTAKELMEKQRAQQKAFMDSLQKASKLKNDTSSSKK